MRQFKNRYMIFELFLDPNRDLKKVEPVKITPSNVTNAIRNSISENFGECGSGSAYFGFQVRYVNHITKVCIVRTSRDTYQRVWSAITLVRSIANCPVVFNLLDLSGNIRACKAAALKYDEMKFAQCKLLDGSSLSDADSREMHNNLEKIKCLEF